MRKQKLKPTYWRILNALIALVWLVNGLYCKVLDYVPRHEQIVARILGAEYSSILIILIGISEIVMAAWIISGYKSRINAALQIFIVLLMNLIEFTFASDLLLWGKMNIVFALLFVLIVYSNEFKLRPHVGIKGV
ncbi:MAG: DoxX-like family protein [Flavobacteriales bacterium]